jgi:hypothetical protein
MRLLAKGNCHSTACVVAHASCVQAVLRAGTAFAGCRRDSPGAAAADSHTVCSSSPDYKDSFSGIPTLAVYVNNLLIDTTKSDLCEAVSHEAAGAVSELFISKHNQHRRSWLFTSSVWCEPPFLIWRPCICARMPLACGVIEHYSFESSRFISFCCR